MKTFLRKVLMFTMVFSMVSGMISTTAEAQETQDSVVIGGSEKLLLEVGKTYSVPVSFKKADTPSESSMAADSLTGSTFSGTMSYLNQNGVYTKMALKTGITDMSQDGYFIFDFTSLNADYSAVNAAIAKVPADLSIYTAETAAVLQGAMDQVEEYYHKERQAEVNAMAVAVEVAVEGLVEDPCTYYNTDVYGRVLATPSTFTVSIPETIQLGTLSIIDDTVVAYSLGVDMTAGNDGKALEVKITSGNDEKLVFGNNEIPLLNSLTSYTFTNSEVIEEEITVEASMVNLAYHGEYQGMVTFYIDSEPLSY